MILSYNSSYNFHIFPNIISSCNIIIYHYIIIQFPYIFLNVLPIFCCFKAHPSPEASAVKRFLRHHEAPDLRFADFVTPQRMVELFPLAGTTFGYSALPWKQKFMALVVLNIINLCVCVYDVCFDVF